MSTNTVCKFALHFVTLCLCCLTHIYGQPCSSSPGVLSQQFRAYSDVDMTTCQPTGQPSSSHLDCARQCTATANCAAFSRNFSTGVCFTCGADQNLNLTFPHGNTLYLANQAIRTDVPLDPTTNLTLLKLPVKCGIYVGTVLYLSGTYLSQRMFVVEFTQKSLINFHFKVQWNELILNYMDANSYGPGQYLVPNPFPFNVNQPAEIHILVGQDKFVVFVNGVYLCEFNHVLPISTIDNINVYHGWKIRQISL